METTQEMDVEEESVVQQQEEEEPKVKRRLGAGFINGLGVGFGIGCVAAFAILWVSVYFSPMLPGNVGYSDLLVIFVYPLLYLLAIGLISLTAGFVREYYSKSHSDMSIEQL